ncbi:MAG: adenylate/guanylate cyclase domain-containing protein [Chloroflexi bacterium]|nr:adenylate/guanylate cyclase domain-containing protein [Chloroflexota bacterium]
MERVALHRHTVLIACAALLLVLVSAAFGAFEFLELRAQDWAFNARGAIAPSTPIVIVGIDDESFTQNGLQWPWPRAYFARIVDRLADAGPRVIALDVSFYESAPGDEALAQAIRKANNVVLVSTIAVVNDRVYNLEQLNQPLPVLSNSAAAIGLSNFPFDRDGFVRRLHAFQVHGGQVYYHWALRVAELVLKQPLPAQPSRDSFAMGDRRIVLDDQSLYINFRGPARTFPVIPAYQVAGGQIKPEFFKDKIVLVGATTESLHDTYPTPFLGDSAPMSGVEIIANSIETVLSGKYLTRAGAGGTLLAIMLLGAIGMALNVVKRPAFALLALAALMLIYAIAWNLVFLVNGAWIPLVAPQAALFLAYVAPAVERGVIEGEEKRRVRRIFEQFVSPEMIEQLVAHGLEATRGRRAQLTILFADIRGFTTMSEQLAPDELARLLNEYLGVMTEVIFRHHGTIDKFEGDAILAFWGAPSPDPHHARNALRAAVEMEQELIRLRDKWAARGQPRALEIGIGVNTGEVFVGLVGSDRRVNYTVVGDHVNIAARLQDLTKEYHWPLLVSEATYAKIKDEFEAEFVEIRHVKGKSIPVGIYRVLGAKSAPPETRIHTPVPVTLRSAGEGAS